MISKISFVAILSLLCILPTSLILDAEATSTGRGTLELPISIGGGGGSSKDCGDKSECPQANIPLLGPVIQAPLLGPVVQAPIVQDILNFVDQRLELLKYLYELDLSNNKLSGPFPMEVLGMTDLVFLDMRFNSFSGAVPPQIFTQDLYALFLNDNEFDQTLPDDLGNTHVLYLTLANNKFTGPIPGSIARALPTLTEVLLLNNRFSGCLPYEIGLLHETVVLDAGNNQLTGPLPLSLLCLEKVEQLNLAGNLFYGTVPEPVCWLGLYRNLVNLSLSDNYFQHAGPWCRALIEKGVLNVRNNCIPDLPSQRPVVDCARFFAQPRPCPRMWSYSYVPCKHAHMDSLAPGIAPSA
ncbi:uncharacterized protein J3R85_003700 [Psidium guajava]|nr:uncharacterized protein J3R85_003700 [Psidium guajava]